MLENNVESSFIYQHWVQYKCALIIRYTLGIIDQSSESIHSSSSHLKVLGVGFTVGWQVGYVVKRFQVALLQVFLTELNVVVVVINVKNKFVL